MYKRTSQGWRKHLDFIVVDEVSLQVAFVLAFLFRHGIFPPYANSKYLAIGIVLAVVDFLVAVLLDSMHNVLKRDEYKEFKETLKHCSAVIALAILLMFGLQVSEAYSRLVILMTYLMHVFISYWARLAWKKRLKNQVREESNKKSMLVVLEADQAERIVGRLIENASRNYSLAGVVLIGNPAELKEIKGIPVVCAINDAARYICREWIDSVFISCNGVTQELRDFVGHCAEMAVPIHYHVPSIGQDESKQFVEKIGGATVLTMSDSYVSPVRLFIKRMMDIVGGVVGCMIALAIIAIVGPKIKKASPGPVLYRSERIGEGGKRFMMYKIRSMYLDAEERKKTLTEKNRVKDGMMFKLDFDPRVIGNEELPDGTRKTGIGEFIRRTSLDEFPQFFNVLKGEMSIVGTRPPTPDEWDKYEYHHRARVATKPGITGMWQVSGRSEITDFEEVVRLDTKYIQNWSIGLDVKIILKTIVNVINRKGAL